MPPSSAGTLAERVARQLGVEASSLGGTEPGGAATLDEVLREAGRPLPAAARARATRSGPAPGEGPPPGARRLEVTCDAAPVRDACEAFAQLVADVPETRDVVVRLCGAALREFPELAGVRVRSGEALPRGSISVTVAGLSRTVRIRGSDEAGIATVRDAVRAADTPSGAESSGRAEDAVDPESAFVVRTGGTDAGSDIAARDAPRPGGAKLAFAERSGSIVFELVLDSAVGGEAEAFLDHLRALCLDPRRALL